jgi:Flp pilus assembly protein TadB
MIRRVTLVVAAALVALIGLPVPSASAAPEPRLVVSGFSAQPGVATFVVTGRNLPDGVALDPAKLRVTVGATALRIEAKASATAAGLPPRAVMVVVDTSFRLAAEAFAATTGAAGRVATALPPDVHIGLVSTAPPTVVLEPTADRGAYTNAVNTLTRAGDGAVYDAMLLAAESLRTSGFGPDEERRLLVLANGTDVVSGAAPAAVGERLAAAGLPVDAVAFGTGGAGASLDVVISATGGRLLPAADPTELSRSVATAGAAFSTPIAVTARVPNELAARAVTLQVSLDGSGLSATTPVTFSSAVLSAAEAPPSGLDWIPGWLAYVIGATFFLGLILIVLTLAWPRSAKHDRIKQIELFGPGRAALPKPEDASAGSVFARTALAATASLVRSGRVEQRITLRLERAGMRLKPHEWVLLRICAVITVSSLLFSVAGIAGAVMGVIIGWLATQLYQTIRIDRRSNQFAEQLPDALQLVIGSLKAGFSLPQALDTLVREAPEPVASEFGRALAEHRLGADVSDALERLAQRTQSDDLGWAVMAVRIQREVGGNLAEVLQTTVDTMRERARLRRHVRALSAEGRVSAWVLIALPLALATFMFFFRRDYLAPLVTTFEGVIMVVTGVMLFLVGIFWMSRVIRVEA